VFRAYLQGIETLAEIRISLQISVFRAYLQGIETLVMAGWPILRSKFRAYLQGIETIPRLSSLLVLQTVSSLPTRN